MKINKYFRDLIYSSIFVFALGAGVSCSDAIKIGDVDEDPYKAATEEYGYVLSFDNPKPEPVFELRREGLTTQLYFALTHKFNKIIDVQLALDSKFVDTYNKQHGTSFEMIPTELVTLDESGKLAVAPGDMASQRINMKVSSSDNLVVGKTYLAPVAIKSVTEGVKLRSEVFYVLLKYQGEMPSADKGNGYKIVSCMEVNDTNPLNNLEFTLKNSGKPLIDIVILFSANLNYNSDLGKIYISCNENVTALLENREHYLKPLQDRGIKVVLGLLGNHDIAGISNMTKETAQYFSQDLKTFADAYHIDGYFLDDEYSSYSAFPGFIFPVSSAAAARFAYEIKQAMPDKLCIAYAYNTTNSWNGAQHIIDGVKPGNFIDYAIADYGRPLYTSSYTGSTINQMMNNSQEYAIPRSLNTNATTINGYKNSGYGGHMIFAMDPNRANFLTQQLPSMQALALGGYGEELVFSGVKHNKDW